MTVVVLWCKSRQCNWDLKCLVFSLNSASTCFTIIASHMEVVSLLHLVRTYTRFCLVWKLGVTGWFVIVISGIPRLLLLIIVWGKWFPYGLQETHAYGHAVGKNIWVLNGTMIHDIIRKFCFAKHLLLWSAYFCLITRPNVDVWRLMADLFNIISELNTGAVVLNEKKTDGNVIVSTVFF